MTAPARLLVIGLDAVEPRVALDLAASGRMPNLQHLLSQGVWAGTRGSAAIMPGSVWPSLYTGSSMYRHGLSAYGEVDVNGRRLAPDASRLRQTTLWDALSAVGRRVAVIDVPHSPLSSMVNGVHVVDWATHDIDQGFRARPVELEHRLLDRFGRHPVGKCNRREDSAAGLAELNDRVLQGIDRKLELTGHLLDQGGWDFFLVVFGEGHCAGHHCWHLHDSTHPRHDLALAETLGDPVTASYEALDRAVGELLTRAGDSTTVALLLSHGMGPSYGASHHLDRILRRLDRASRSRLSRTVGRTVELTWDLIPGKVYYPLVRRRHETWRGLGERLWPTDPTRRPWYKAGYSTVASSVRINLAGRDLHGSVAPSDVDRVCDLLTADLLALIDPTTGRRLVRKVVRVERPDGVESLDYLPDLVIAWDQDAPAYAVRSSKVGTIRGISRHMRTGDHRPDGLFVLRRPDASPGELPSSVPITDVTPTLAALLDVDLPDAEGHPIAAMVGTSPDGDRLETGRTGEG